MSMTCYGIERPIDCGPGKNKELWINWRTELRCKTEEYLKSDGAWKHNFSDEPRESGFDCEASHLSKQVFELFLRAAGCKTRNPQTDPIDTDANMLGYRGLKIEDRPSDEDGFYFDVMNNPNTGGLAYMRHDSNIVPTFKCMYHEIGNFGLLPEWLRHGDRSLQLVHKYMDERWDALMQYELIPRFESISPSDHIDFTRYIELNCAYQYIYGCPEPEEGWRDNPEFDWKAQVEEWKGWLRRESNRRNIRIASIVDCGQSALADSWSVEKEKLSSLLNDNNLAARSKMDDWICNLIEARGRCIVAIARTQL